MMRRGATLESRAHPDVQASLRDVTLGLAPPPWVETHGYRHFVAPRRPRAPQALHCYLQDCSQAAI